MNETIPQLNKQDFYKTNGYVVFRNLVPFVLIEEVINLYKTDIAPSRDQFFRQNIYKYESNKLNKFGYVKQSFLDIHDYKRYPIFSQSVLDIFCGHDILDALKHIVNYHSFNLMQSMLFDANTQTMPHQEWWYLDTVPNGHLIIAWIALEDIDERAGRFYVIPKNTDNIDFHSDTPNLEHSQWLKKIKKYVKSNQEKVVAPDLKKGDVMFINSATIHGSLPTIDASFSRKSLTAHYIPSEYSFGNLFKTKKVNYQTYRGVKFYKAHLEYSLLNKLMFDASKLVYKSPRILKILRRISKVTNYKE